MNDQSTAGAINMGTTAAILSEYDIFKQNYANDSLVQAMAAKLAELSAAQSSPRQLRHADMATSMVTVLEPAPTGTGARVAWDKYREGVPLPAEDAFLFAAGYLAGQADAPEVESDLNSSDRERLLYVARVLRAIADLDVKQGLGSLGQEAVVACGAIKRVLDIQDEDCEALGMNPLSMMPPAKVSSIRSPLMNGWKEAAIAWTVCASVHERFAKGRDALFTTRQADYVRHAAVAKKAYHTVLGAEQGFDAEVLLRLSAATAGNFASALELIKAIAKLDARTITAKSTKSVAQRWLREHKAVAAAPVGELLHVGTLSVFPDSEASFGHGYDISTNAPGHLALQLMDGAEVYVVKPKPTSAA